MSDADITGQHTVEIGAAADAVWGLITDPANQGALSPECQRAEWEGDLAEPVTGAKIHGYNKAGEMEWDAVATVTASTPGELWQFVVGDPDDENATTWKYEIASTGNASCSVTESFHAPILRAEFFQTMDPPRHTMLMGNLESTLGNLKALAES